MLVRFQGSKDAELARSWGAARGLELLRSARDASWFVFRAPLEAARLPALSQNRIDGALEVTPILHDLSETAEPSPVPASAGYHRIPKERNLLVVLFDSAPDDDYRRCLRDFGGVGVPATMSEWEKGRERPQIARFPDAGSASAAQGCLASVRAVRQVGPFLSSSPLALLTNEIVVRFASAADAERAELLSAARGLERVRELSYVENGFLYRLPAPSYGIYDIAREFLLEHHALFAVPNVATFGSSACHEAECQASGGPAYLPKMNACAPRAAAPVTGVVLGLLDEGIQAYYWPLAAERLRVGTAIDFDTMRACRPADPLAWWQDAVCTQQLWPNENGKWGPAAHGNRMAYVAATDCDAADLMGVAPAVTLINARRADSGGQSRAWTDVAFADALWWLAGGDPGWCRDRTNYPCDHVPCSATTPAQCSEGALPGRLDADQRASVINLSFVRDDFTDQDCADAATCKLVCASDPSHCGVVAGVLERIRAPQPNDGVRAGGAVVVAAAGIKGANDDSKLCFDLNGQPTIDPGPRLTDLAESAWTVAVGSVETSGEPFYLSGSDRCLINFGGGFLDVVAPLGKNSTLCESCGKDAGPIDAGESSAATAAVSGVVALMLQQNPGLTADQAHCILRLTAARHDGVGDIWENSKLAQWKGLACEYVAGHSNCLGYGMVDAVAAVDLARLIANPALAAAVCVPPLATACSPSGSPPNPVTGAHRTDVWELQEAGALRWRLPAEWTELQGCLVRGTCRCAGSDRACVVRARVRNSLRALIPAAQLQVCRGTECREFEGPPVNWAEGQELELGLAMTSEYLDWVRRASAPLEVRLFSEGRPVTKRALAELRRRPSGPRVRAVSGG